MVGPVGAETQAVRRIETVIAVMYLRDRYRYCMMSSFSGRRL
jgi:hypothetical protein